MESHALWSTFRLDPRAHAQLRAADDDRDIVRSCLGDAFADGRLDRAEFDERMEAVDASRLLGDLLAPLEDLVIDARPLEPGEQAAEPVRTNEIVTVTPQGTRTGDGRAEDIVWSISDTPGTPAEIQTAAEQHYARQVRQSVASFLTASTITTLVWLALGLFTGGFALFWPIFVMLGTGIGVVSTIGRRRLLIEERRKKLTRRAQKQGMLPPGDAGSRLEDRRELRRRRMKDDDTP